MNALACVLTKCSKRLITKTRWFVMVQRTAVVKATLSFLSSIIFLPRSSQTFAPRVEVSARTEYSGLPFHFRLHSFDRSVRMQRSTTLIHKTFLSD